jgi:wyosine [tRNA(Phe)-imidazoG37] synthetase (radical SAM superfamily)
MGKTADSTVNPDVLLKELSRLLKDFDNANICRLSEFTEVPDKDKRLRDVALSGDGEPTLAANFRDICVRLSEFQLTAPRPFKLVLITNAANLVKPDVMAGLDAIMKSRGEIWAKLDAGNPPDFLRINRPRASLSRVEAGLLTAGRNHPIYIQSLFFRMNGSDPSPEQVRDYCSILNRLVAAGCRISGIQLHTIVRKPAEPCCRPLNRESLQQYAAEITRMTGLSVKVH